MADNSTPPIRKSTFDQKHGYFARDAKNLFERLDDLNDRTTLPGKSPSFDQQDSISSEIAREQRIKNDDAEQDIRLKKLTLRLLFLFLGSETFVVFMFAYSQAIGWPFSFHLDETSFRILIGATIAQINGMLFVAVRYLFPAKGK